MLTLTLLLILLFAGGQSVYGQLQPLGIGSIAGVNDWVFAMLNDTDDDLLYVGGNFTTVGNIYSPFIATWDGNSWSAVGSGFNGPVRAICKFQGDIYVAGEFDMAGTDTVNYVARWDGVNWNPVGEGFNDFAITLCVFNNQLYAGGVFTVSGSDTTKKIARWSGTKWSEVGGGLTGPGTGFVTSVFALTVFQNQLYVGGNFNSANNGSVVLDGNFVRWNGFSWQDIPNYTSGPDNLVTCFGQDNGLLWVGAHDVAEILTFDGSNWLFGNDSPTPSFGVNAAVYAVEFYDGSAYVGGQFDAAGYPSYNDEFVNGIKNEEWFSLDGGVNNSVFCLEVYHDELYIGGAFPRINNGFVQCNYIARWKSPLQVGISKTDGSCNGMANGSIALTPENGVAPFSYAWGDSPNTTFNRTGLAPGNYFFTVTDNSGRIASDTIVITTPSPLSANVTISGTSGQNGSVMVTASGGVSPYYYIWSNGATTASIAGLSSGTYNLTITDSNGCDTVINAFVDTLISNGIQHSEESKWTVYPNPANEYLMICNHGDWQDGFQIYLYNVMGEKVVGVTWPRYENTIKINISDVPPGIYHLLLWSDKADAYMQKLMIW